VWKETAFYCGKNFALLVFHGNKLGLIVLKTVPLGCHYRTSPNIRQIPFSPWGIWKEKP